MSSKRSSWHQLIHMTFGPSLNYFLARTNVRYSSCSVEQSWGSVRLFSSLSLWFGLLFDTTPGHWHSKQVRKIKSSIHTWWPIVTGIISWLCPFSLALGCRWQRGKWPQSSSRVLGLYVSSDTVIVQQLKSEREGVGMGVGGIKCFRSCCHCKPSPKNNSSFDDSGPDKVRLSIHRPWLTKDRGEAELCDGSVSSTDILS